VRSSRYIIAAYLLIILVICLSCYLPVVYAIGNRRPTLWQRTEGIHLCIGTDSNDHIDGTKSSDLIICLAGDDLLRGGHGNDVIQAGADNDKIYGNTGGDNL
jgi:hypothetical protein